LCNGQHLYITDFKQSCMQQSSVNDHGDSFASAESVNQTTKIAADHTSPTDISQGKIWDRNEVKEQPSDAPFNSDLQLEFALQQHVVWLIWDSRGEFLEHMAMQGDNSCLNSDYIGPIQCFG
jgi:hypothetical protein